VYHPLRGLFTAEGFAACLRRRLCRLFTPKALVNPSPGLFQPWDKATTLLLTLKGFMLVERLQRYVFL
jgi:hypothetical protein